LVECRAGGIRSFGDNLYCQCSASIFYLLSISILTARLTRRLKVRGTPHKGNICWLDDVQLKEMRCWDACVGWALVEGMAWKKRKWHAAEDACRGDGTFWVFWRWRFCFRWESSRASIESVVGFVLEIEGVCVFLQWRFAFARSSRGLLPVRWLDPP
jgi:hypothetical protein